MSAVRVLVVTNIFPNALDPSGAPYNRRQFGELGKLCEVDVLALVPWFPGAAVLGRIAAARMRAARLSALPSRWGVDGLEVCHPRVLYLPRIGRAIAGPLYTASLAPHVLGEHRAVDVVLGSFGYPDGWAAVALSRLLGVPAVIKVHGSDVNVHGAGPLSRQLGWALRRAAAVVGPSRPLVARAVELGARPASARVVPNGIDRHTFYVRDRAAARRALGLPAGGELVLFVGRLEPQKGTGELLDALPQLHARRPGVKLVLIGDGVAADEYRFRVRAEQLPVELLGARAHDEVATWMAACDVLALPSWAEGTPNVVLEALACGRPVVASRVGGIPDVVTDPALGELVAPRRSADLAAALARVLGQRRHPQTIAARAPLLDWKQSAGALHRVLQEACSPRADAQG